MNLTTLEHFLDQNEIPVIKKKPKTFLGIAKQPHYENVLSNIYAFFFDVDEEHGMKDLFLQSFLELINETELGKKRNIEFNNDFTIETESRTIKEGRIDLLLSDDYQAIIIESKVKHHLNNDLNDYWDSIPLNREGDAKIGIVLSIKKYSKAEIPHEDFINITHQEFLQKVMGNSGMYLPNASNKYIVFFKDLYQNIMNLSNTMNKENIAFYYRNQEELNKAAKLKFAVRDFIKSEIEHACGLIEEKLTFRSPKSGSGNEKRLRYFVCPKHKKLMFTIVFDGLLNDKKELWIIVEPTNQSIQKAKEFKKENFDEKERLIVLDSIYETPSTSWAHFASERYVLKDEDIENLQQFIKKKIENDGFLSIYKKLKKHLIQ